MDERVEGRADIQLDSSICDEGEESAHDGGRDVITYAVLEVEIRMGGETDTPSGDGKSIEGPNEREEDVGRVGRLVRGMVNVKVEGEEGVGGHSRGEEKECVGGPVQFEALKTLKVCDVGGLRHVLPTMQLEYLEGAAVRTNQVPCTRSSYPPASVDAKTPQSGREGDFSADSESRA